MVQNDSSNSGDESTPIIPENPAKGIACGNFRLVGWGIDTTGRRLIDEICQIAVYTPETEFHQYIMPFNDINPTFQRKHSLKIVNTVRYRRLKNLIINDFVKAKSEISALTDFLSWLEQLKGDSDGIILVYHEIRKSSPGMLLEALKRYNFVEKFQSLVKGFANGFNIAQAKCANTTKSFSLRIMSKVLLNKENEHFSSAVDRARASYDIAAHLSQGEREDLDTKASGDCTGKEPHLIEFICPFSNPIEVEEAEIAEFKILLERQNTFRPVFGALMRATRTERQHASHLRRLLAENNVNYDKLKEAFETDARTGLETIIKKEVANAKENEIEELLEILDCFFDPEKKAVQPKTRPYNNNNRKPRRKSINKNRNSESQSPNASSDNPEGVETTTETNIESQSEVTAN